MTKLTILVFFLFSNIVHPIETEEFVTSGTLTIEISNIAVNTGYIRIAVYNSESQFLNEKQAILTKSVLVENERQISVDIPNLSHGTYAVAVFQDLNSNSKLDKNLLGIPKEPYAISNNVGGKWEIPKYKNHKFDFSEKHGQILMELKKWNQH
jgi:uncharacterized protein (DUF2141 family)